MVWTRWQSAIARIDGDGDQPAVGELQRKRPVLANTYDSNGNTLGANGRSYAYDSMDRMTSFNNGAGKDGLRWRRESRGEDRRRRDDAVPGGRIESDGAAAGNGRGGKERVVQRSYLYGLRRISQTSQTISYYGYDAHGDVRYLMNNGGAGDRHLRLRCVWEHRGKHGNDAERLPVPGEALDSETGLYYIRRDTTTRQWADS